MAPKFKESQFVKIKGVYENERLCGIVHEIISATSWRARGHNGWPGVEWIYHVKTHNCKIADDYEPNFFIQEDDIICHVDISRPHGCYCAKPPKHRNTCCCCRLCICSCSCAGKFTLSNAEAPSTI